MKDELSFNITKLEETIDIVRESYEKYRQNSSALNQEIKKLDVTWGNTSQSIWNDFKEKYEEKKSKLIEAEKMMKELLDELVRRKEQLQEATINARNSFE